MNAQLTPSDQLPSGPAIRPASPSELALAVDIDRDACTAFAELDSALDIELPTDHPYALAEVARWNEIVRAGHLFFACSAAGEPVGFAALCFVDGRPFLDQLSVRRVAMRRGVGRSLMALAQHWSAPKGELWLTTYRHVPWNAPWYERLGFARVAESMWGPELRAIVDSERGALPCPDQRIAMVYRGPRA
jgi:GNAT superfamily N-acetyltransferase